MIKFKRILKKMMIGLIIIVVTLAVAATIFLQKKTFGNKPEGNRLERIKKSTHYVDGTFQNLSKTPMMSEDASYFKMLKKYFWNDGKTEPSFKLSGIKSDLKTKPATNKPTFTWFGHSSLYLQINGKNILVDPVFSERPSPTDLVGSKSYPGTMIYSASDFPNLDFVFITHDHYDHLDYNTIVELKDKVGKFYCPLGVGSHLEHWGVDTTKINEFDWWEGEKISEDLQLIATPARHFSGRGLTDRNKTLWASYVLLSPEYRIYFGGDSGYDTHFKNIGEKYGPFDIAFLESGQYHNYWPYIHMLPEQTVQAALDLKAKILQPVHWGKFTLAMHPWDEPIQRVNKKAAEVNLKLTTPKIGEKVILDSIYPESQWWIQN